MKDIHSWVRSNIKSDGIIIEAGACDGQDTVFFSNLLSSGKVYSFEPIAQLYNKAAQKLRGRTNVELHNKALSDTTAIRKMFVSDRFGADWGSSSFLSPKEHLQTNPEITFKSETDVESVLLDEFIASKDINHIDLMWLDMQGYEPVVLQCSPKALAMTRFLYTEVSLVENYEGLVKYPDYKKFLEDNNFEVIEEGLYWADGGNVLFKNNSFA